MLMSIAAVGAGVKQLSEHSRLQPCDTFANETFKVDEGGTGLRHDSPLMTLISMLSRWICVFMLCGAEAHNNNNRVDTPKLKTVRCSGERLSSTTRS